jgi:hypothetical protein
MAQEHPSIQRVQVVLQKAVQLQVYNGLFTTDSIRCHQASYRKYTESTISIQNVTSSRAEFEGKRWVFGWSDIPELSSRAYMVSLFSECQQKNTSLATCNRDEIASDLMLFLLCIVS